MGSEGTGIPDAITIPFRRHHRFMAQNKPSSHEKREKEEQNLAHDPGITA